jgi:predicted ATPase
MLTSLTIENYKSLHSVKIDPPPFFVVVGANAAGKTNFGDAIEFLGTVAKSGLAAALNEKGGYENVCFRRQRRSKGAIILGCRLEQIRSGGASFQLDISFSFRAQKEAIRSSYVVESERLDLAIERQGGTARYLQIARLGKTVSLEVFEEAPNIAGMLPTRILKEILEKEKVQVRDDDLLLWTLLRGLPPFAQILGELARFRVFQIAPSFARKAGAASGNQELGKYGDNLPAVLDWLKREHQDAFARLLVYAQQAVPTIKHIETDYVETRELGLFLREQGIQRRLFASELSDGTLRTLAMFLPLVDPRIPFVVVEEPENSIHPWVVRTFVDACRACSKNKQIVLTTHSPVLVSKLDPAELYVAERINGETRVVSAMVADVRVADIVQRGIQDLGSYWDSGAMRAVPADPQYQLEFPNGREEGKRS